MIMDMFAAHFLFILFWTASSSSNSDSKIPGHLEPLGHHRKPEGGVTILNEFPLPTDFYENYVAKSQPFVVKGVLENGGFPAYKLWTDKYLATRYGEINIDVEGGKKEDRNANAFVMPLSKFLEVYNRSRIYMVHDVANEMKGDITVPVSLQCGGLQNVIKAVITWFSSGGTKSVLHNDGLDNINCLLDGNKDLIMFHKKYKEDIEADHFIKTGAYSKVDVDSVDMIKFPRLRHIPWYLVNITKGDCLFIPYQWYHHVYSHPGRNLAVNIWSNHLRWFNKSDCEGREDKLKPLSLKDITIHDADDASEVEEFRYLLSEMFDGLEAVTPLEFKTGFRQFAPGDIPDEVLSEIFELIDIDKDQILTMYEFHAFDVSAIPEIIPDMDSLFGKEEPPSEGYGSPDRKVTHLTMDDDVTFLLNEIKSEGTKNLKKDGPNSYKEEL